MARRAERQPHVLSCNCVTPVPSINYRGWTKGGVHGKDQDVHAVSASMAVAGKVGKALHKECVGIYNVGIMSVETCSESVDGC